MNHDGEYEKTLHKTTVPICDTAKRLLSCMRHGVTIHSEDGHRWLVDSPTMAYEERCLNRKLQDVRLPIMREKCYGTLFDALDRVDGALKALNYPSLLEYYNEEDWI